MNVTGVRLGGRPDRPLLVLGPALGTTASGLWSDAGRVLGDEFQVVGWDLPGHGTNRIPPDPDAAPPSVADLAAAVVELVDQMCPVPPGAPPTRFDYAGVSVGGAVGLQLLLDHPDRVETATLLCTGARLGTSQGWAERVAAVRAGGTEAVVELSRQRWWAPGFEEREPERASRLVRDLRAVDDEGYAAVCGALAAYDVRDRLGGVIVPVLAVAGAADVATPPDLLREVADGVADGRLVVLDDVAHLAPAEAPEEVARLVRAHALGLPPESGLGAGVKVLVTGGVRSGKSRHAASLLGPDGGGPGWATPPTTDLAAALRTPGPVLVDGLAAWLTGVLDARGLWEAPLEEATAVVSELLDEATAALDARDDRHGVVLVTHEVGWGLAPKHRSERVLRDLLGLVNQRVAAHCAEVHLVVAGRVLRL